MTHDDNTEALKNSLEPLMGCKFLFGLRNQGHIPTIMNMLRLGDSWNDIGKEIGWVAQAAKEEYDSLFEDPDFDDLEYCKNFLALTNSKVWLEPSDDSYHFWHVRHPNGSISISHASAPEEEAIRTGAIFVFLWYKGGISPGFARDLACSYTQIRRKDTDKFKDLV